jgi:hypothetical protein
MWTRGPVRVQLTLRGDADYEEGEQVRAAVERAIATGHCPVRSAQVVLFARHDSRRPMVEVDAVVDVGCEQVHAAVSAATAAAAADVVEHRLTPSLSRVTGRAQAARWVPRRRAPR